MKKIVKSRELFMILTSLALILLISSCKEVRKEKFVEIDETQSKIENQINEIIEVGNAEVIKLTRNIGNRLVFEYMNLEDTYDIESSFDFFVNGNKLKFSSILYGVNEDGEIYFEIEELPGKQIQLNVVNATGVIQDIDIMSLSRTIYYNQTEQKVLENTEIVLGVIIYSVDEKSTQQVDEIIAGHSIEEAIQKEDYIFVLKTKFKISDDKK